MNSTKIDYNKSYGKSGVRTPEPLEQLAFFETKIDYPLEEQLKTLNELEEGLPISDGKAFQGQVHFQYAYQTPVQRWFPYREGYSIELVNTFIKNLNIKGNIFDPFMGSGTTLLASRMNDLNSFGIDINPISASVAKVENERYSLEDVVKIDGEIKKFNTLAKPTEIFQTSFELADKIFNREILQALLQFKHYIKAINDEKVRNLFFMAWLSIIEEVSNIKKEGNGIKYKNRKRTPNGYINIEKEKWENEIFPSDKYNFVKTKFTRHLEIILFDLKYSYGKCDKKPIVYEGDCLEFDKFLQHELELSFFSPPYCNCFDYFEIHKVELWLGDFISNKEEFRKLRNTGFRSNTNSLNHKPIKYTNVYLEKLISMFDCTKIWNNRIPNLIRGYFDDMHTLLTKLSQQTIKKGFVGIVVGNSAYSGIIIPTDMLIADIAKEMGFKIKGVFVSRHLTTSSQQKQGLEYVRNYLRESIVLLQR